MDPKFQVTSDVDARFLSVGDTQAMIEVIRRNFERFSPWFSWTTGGFAEERVVEYVAEAQADLEAGAEFPYALHAGPHLIGTAGLYRIDRRNGIARIGYWIDEGYQGRGIVTLTVRELVTRAFRDAGLNRIEIRCAPENSASRRIPERLGFAKEGTHREVLALHGRHQDLIMYSMLKRDWNANNM